MATQTDDTNESIDTKIESAITSVGALILGLMLSIAVFYMRPQLASSFLVDRRPILGLIPPRVLTTLILSLFFSSSFWFYYANPDGWAFIFSYYLQDHANDYSQLLDLESLAKTMSVVAPLGLALYLSTRIFSLILERLGSVGCHFQTLLFAVSIPYFAVSQSILLALDVYSKLAQSDTYLYLAILLILITTLVATALFIGHSLHLSKIESITRKVVLLGTAYVSYTILVFISISLPHTIGVGEISNVKLEGPLNLSISSTGQGDCELDFFVTVKNRAKIPVSIIEPKISQISIRPDPLHSNLYGYSSTSDKLALATSSGTSKVIILKPNGMEWIHFRLSIPGFTHEIAGQFLKKIKLGENDTSYREPRIEVEFDLQSDGNMISDEVKTWVSKGDITSRGIDY